MTTSKRPPSDPPGGRRKRPPTVINLEATEVPTESSAKPAVEQSPASDTPAPPPAADAPPVPPAEAALEKAAAFEKASYEPPPPPPPESDPKFKSEPEPPRAAAMPPPDRPPPRGFLNAPHLISGAFGAAGGFALFLLLWLSGVFTPTPPPAPPDLSPRFAALEKQLNDLAARPAPAAVDPRQITGPLDRSIEDVSARLARLETAVSAPRAPVTDPVVLGRINAAEGAVKTLADNVAAMARREDALEARLRDTGAKADDRAAKLAASVTELQTRARETAAGSDRGSRLALAAAALRDRVERGDAYASELALVKPLAADTAAIAALEPFAATGLPNAAKLGEALAAIVRPLLRAAGEAPRDGGFVEKLYANAEKLVRIRPADEARGDDRAAILSRIEQRAAQGNVTGALAELLKLPADARGEAAAPLAAWTAKAEARAKALDASRRLATDAVAALKMAP